MGSNCSLLARIKPKQIGESGNKCPSHRASSWEHIDTVSLMNIYIKKVIVTILIFEKLRSPS